MGVEYRKDRDRWGFRLSLPGGKRLKLYRWATKEEAEKAYQEEAKLAKLPKTSLVVAVEDYLADSLTKRSQHRYDDLGITFEKWIVPYWGPQTLITQITSKSIEQFIAFHQHTPHVRDGRAYKVSNLTIWHYIKDLKALLNWCIKESRLEENPVTKADLSPIKNRKRVKPPLDIEAISRGIETLRDRERLYVDTLRFLGLRMDEGNRIQACDVLDHGKQMWLVVKGTKTEGSERVVPIPPGLQASYRFYVSQAQPTDYIMCKSGDKTYSRRRLFWKISKAAGVHVTPKDMRDYFASIVRDATVASQMLGHTNLRTTGIYVRQVQSRMVEAVELLGLPQPKNEDSVKIH